MTLPLPATRLLPQHFFLALWPKTYFLQNCVGHQVNGNGEWSQGDDRIRDSAGSCWGGRGMTGERNGTKVEGDETRCKGKGNVFRAIVLRRVSATAHFRLCFWRFEFVSIPGQLFPTACDNTGNKFVTCKHAFCTPNISYGTFKHWYCTLKHIVRCMRAYILHNKGYHTVHASIHFHTKAYHTVSTNIHFHTITYHVTRAHIHVSHQSVSPQ